jgi:hypothetical protein
MSTPIMIQSNLLVGWRRQPRKTQERADHTVSGRYSESGRHKFPPWCLSGFRSYPAEFTMTGINGTFMSFKASPNRAFW